MHFSSLLVVPAELWRAYVGERVGPRDAIERAVTEMLAPYEEAYGPEHPYVEFVDGHEEIKAWRVGVGSCWYGLPEGGRLLDLVASYLAGERPWPKEAFRVSVVEAAARFDLDLEEASPLSICAAWLGEYERNEEGRWGVWENPNGLWDGWQIGGLFGKRLPVKRVWLSHGLVDIALRGEVDLSALAEIRNWARRALVLRLSAMRRRRDAKGFFHGLRHYGIIPCNRDEVAAALSGERAFPELVYEGDPIARIKTGELDDMLWPSTVGYGYYYAIDREGVFGEPGRGNRLAGPETWVDWQKIEFWRTFEDHFVRGGNHDDALVVCDIQA